MNREKLTFRFPFRLDYLILTCLLWGCADRIPATFAPYEAVDLNDSILMGEYAGKIANLLVIMDTSSTMNEPYLYEAFDSNTIPSMFDVEKEVVKRLNQAIPAIDMNAGIRTYGFGPCHSWSFSMTRLKLGPYRKDTFNEAIDSIECASGGSPLDYAIETATEDLEPVSGNTAVIIISDGEIADDAFAAAFEMKKEIGKGMCIHTISLGNGPDNRSAMRRLASLSRCGYTTTAEELATSSGMADFVEKVFLRSKKTHH